MSKKLGVHKLDYEKLENDNYIQFLLDLFHLPHSYVGINILFNEYVAPIDMGEIKSRVTYLVEYPKIQHGVYDEVNFLKDYYGLNEENKKYSCKEIVDKYNESKGPNYYQPATVKKLIDTLMKMSLSRKARECISSTGTYLDKLITERILDRRLVFRLYRDNIRSFSDYMAVDYKIIDYPDWELYENAKLHLTSRVSQAYQPEGIPLYQLLADESIETIAIRGFLNVTLYKKFIYFRFLETEFDTSSKSSFSDKYAHLMNLFEFTKWFLKNPNCLYRMSGFGPRRLKDMVDFFEKMYGVELQPLFDKSKRYVLGYSKSSTILTLIENYENEKGVQ